VEIRVFEEGSYSGK